MEDQLINKEFENADMDEYEKDSNESDNSDDEGDEPRSKKRKKTKVVGPSFENLTQEMLKFHEMAKRIQYESRRVIRMGLFEINCERLINDLSKRAEVISDQLMDRIMEIHRFLNRKYVKYVYIFIYLYFKQFY